MKVTGTFARKKLLIRKVSHVERVQYANVTLNALSHQLLIVLRQLLLYTL
jgi:hypothetical protein